VIARPRIVPYDGLSDPWCNGTLLRTRRCVAFVSERRIELLFTRIWPNFCLKDCFETKGDRCQLVSLTTNLSIFPFRLEIPAQKIFSCHNLEIFHEEWIPK